MTTTLYPYRNGEQFKKYIGQFIRVFSGFQVRDGVERAGSFRTKRVPVVYGSMSRVVANVLTQNKRFLSSTVPLLAVNMASIDIDTESKRNSYHTDHISKHRIGSDSTLSRKAGPGFILGMELSIYASSTTELFEILEQILLIFNPRVAIQVDTDANNADYITDIVLTGIQPEIQYPLSTEKEVLMLTMTFDVPVRLVYPHGVDDTKIIHEITSNIIDESGEDILTSHIPERVEEEPDI
tara:strand:+ start:896 stop:1612 length:717 start_codon:yes stop_codon:yes gene_type:complete